MITLLCPNTLNSKLFVLLGCVSLCSHSLIMIMNAENIDINSKKKKKKEYRDCIYRKWREDWDMNETL